MSATPPRALLVRRGGLGDTLLLTAVLRALRRTLPAGHALHVAGAMEFAPLLQWAGVVDAVGSSEDLAAWSPAQCRARLLGCTHVFADDPAIVAAAPAEAVARAFDPRPQNASPLPLQLAAQLGLTLHWPDDQALVAPVVDRAWAAAVVLAPGSGGRAKCWPPAHWLQLARLLVARGLPVVAVVGPVEVERDDPRRWPWPAGVCLDAPNDTIELAQRAAGARAYVGNDSGPTHLAAMLGRPTVALFGPSDASVFGPSGPQVCVLQAEQQRLEALPPERVVAALRQRGVA